MVGNVFFDLFYWFFMLEKLSIPLELLINLISKFTPKKNLVLFSEWGGAPRNDNAEILFRYMLENNQNCFFITKQKQSSDKKKYLYAYSFKGLYYQLRAKKFIYANGKSDFIRAMISKSSLSINVWHGLPIKKIYLDKLNLSALKKNIWSIRNYIFPFLDERPDIFVSNSKCYNEVFVRSFSPQRVINCEMPRWHYISNLKRNGRKVDCQKISILYAPTFRDNDSSYFPLSNSELSTLDIIFESASIQLFISIHPVCSFELLEDFSSIFETDNHFNGINECLADMDYVVSDISSVLIDAKALCIPSFIYFPDENDYIKNSRSLNIEAIDLISDIKHIKNFRDVKSLVLMAPESTCKNKIEPINGLDYLVSEINKL
jgi:CDP-glycerol glycerophosphotransferase